MKADMQSAGLDVSGLARAAELSIPTVSNVLRGASKSTKSVKKIAFALGYPIARYVIQPRERKGVAA